jgi:sulfite exporter TauE/SafE
VLGGRQRFSCAGGPHPEARHALADGLMAQSALIAAFVAGLLGGLHCLAMCGGYVTALAAAPAGKQLPILPARALLFRQFVTHGGRLAAYAALGGLFGAAGGGALGVDWAPLQRVLYLVANLMLIVLAVAIARGASPMAWLERAGLALYRRLLPVVGPLAAGRGLPSRFGLGVLWGLTPCGLVYGVLPVAMLSGNAASGALVMLLFGLGTLPNLVAAGYALARVQSFVTRPAVRYTAATVIIAFALVGLWRAWTASGALAHSPFCIVP